MFQIPASFWLALFFSLFFAAWGVFLPFWPLWLEGQGISESHIGLLMGGALLLRAAASLIIVPRVKGATALLPAIRGLLFSCLLVCSGFLFVQGQLMVAALTLLLNFVISPLMPLGDAIATRWVAQIRMDYGKVRLWGSVSFIFASVLVGALISKFSDQVVLYAMLLCLLLAFLASLIKPSPLPADNISLDSRGSTLMAIAKLPTVQRFLIITACIQGSHAAYYAYSSVYWKSEGYSGTTIGYLWGLGVVVEVLFMALASRFFGSWSANRLFMLAGVGVLVRWSLMALSSALPVLVFTQSLHALTFAACQIGIIRFIADENPPERAIGLQALYSGLSLGLITALLTFLLSVLYQSWQAWVFALMALLALPVLALCYRREV